MAKMISASLSILLGVAFLLLPIVILPIAGFALGCNAILVAFREPKLRYGLLITGLVGVIINGIWILLILLNIYT